MIFYEGQLMVLWRFSDLILLLFTGVLIQNILFLLFAAGHRFLENYGSNLGASGRDQQ